MDNIFKDTGESAETEDSKKIPLEKKIPFKNLIGKEVISWIRGDMEGKPSELKQLGEDFAQKLNWYIGCALLAQYARIPSLFDALEILGDKLFDEKTLDYTVDVEELTALYSTVSKEITNVMNFAQRYVTQNKDLLVDNTNFFERQLFEKIKSMSVEQIRDYLSLFQIIDIRGQLVLKEIIEKYK